MYRHYELRVQWGMAPTSLTSTPHGNTGTDEHHTRSDPTLLTHTYRLLNHNRGRAPGDHHRDQQPTPKIPRPGNTSRNLPTPHTTTTVLHFRLGYGNRNDDRLTQY